MAASLVGGLLLLGIGIAGLLGRSTGLGLVGVAGIAMLAATIAQGRVLKRAELWYAAAHLPDEALRMTSDGLLLGAEGATEPVFLPWSAVAGFRAGQAAGQPTLTLLLTPGVTPSTPGVRGLDQPAVVRAFAPAQRGRGIFYSVAALDRGVEEIDAAL